MVIQLSKLFRINVAGLLDAGGTTLVLDETTGTDLVTTLAGALGLTVGAADEVESAKEEKVQVVDGPRFNPRIGDTMHRPRPQDAAEAAASARHWQAWRVWERIGETLTVAPYYGVVEGQAETWTLDFWSKAGFSGWTYARGEAPAQKRDIITEAVAAAISAPASAATPLKPSKPLTDRARSVQSIHAYLNDCGASFADAIANELGYSLAGVYYTLTKNSDLFAVAGQETRSARKNMKQAALWDLRWRVGEVEILPAPATCAEKVVSYLQTHESATPNVIADAIGMTTTSVGIALAGPLAGVVETCGEVRSRPAGRAPALWRLKAGQGGQCTQVQGSDSTIGTAEADRPAVVPELAPDFLPSGPAPVVNLAPRTGARTGLSYAVETWLRAHGPATYQAAAAALNMNADRVRDAVRKCKTFVRCGQVRSTDGHVAVVWGVAGVHAVEKAAEKVSAEKKAPTPPQPAAVPAPAPVAQTRRPIKSSTAERRDSLADRLHKLLVVNGPRFADDLAFTTGENLATVITCLNVWESDRFTRTGRTIPTPGGLPRVEWAANSDAWE